MSRTLSVLKLGGSVLRDQASYAAAARFLHDRLARSPAERLVVIVSAQYGSTDALLGEAEAIAAGSRGSEARPPSREALRQDRLGLEPARAAACLAVAQDAAAGANAGGRESEADPPSEVNSEALDLLWSTGELRSVALLTLNLHRLGIDAVPFNVHQTGLIAERSSGTTVRPLRLLAALGTARIVVVPGFLGVSAGGTITSLGRGGSDLTAVLLAAGVRAHACELIKDVPGYFTSDPHRNAQAQPIQQLSIDDALAMADAGCDLVQRAALVAAAAAGLHIVIRSLDAAAPVTHLRSQHHGIRHEDDSRRAAVGA